MTKMLLPMLVLFIAIGVLAALTAKKNVRKATGDLAGKVPLTRREQAMYFRLLQTFPDHVVLAQVAFSALITTRDRPTRATFDRKVCDFVLCSKAFEVQAVIELDDASHKGRADADARRAAILTSAGYRVERFAQVPNEAELHARFNPPTTAPITAPA